MERVSRRDSRIEIWRSKYNEFEEIIVVNGIVTALKVRTEIDLRNLLFGIKHEYKYIINFLIRQNKRMKIAREELLSNVDPTNIVVSLKDIKQLTGRGKWFVNTKLDGITSVIAYLKDVGLDGKTILVGYELKGKGVNEESREIFNIEVTDALWETNIIFLGEYYIFENSDVEKIYIFMEANDMNESFKIDYDNIVKFKRNCGKEGIGIIDINNIVIAKKTEDYKVITKKILDIKSKMGDDFPETDGLVYGRIEDKFQLKWKPPELNTIDFYLIFGIDTLYLYAAENKYKAIARLKGQDQFNPNYLKNLRKLEGAKKIPVKLIIEREGFAKYILQLYTIQKYKKEQFDDEQDKMDIQLNQWKEEFNERIVECKFLECMWIPYRVREDKKNPNNFRIADAIWDTISNPIKISDLLV
jgi:hypothetical protein